MRVSHSARFSALIRSLSSLFRSLVAFCDGAAFLIAASLRLCLSLLHDSSIALCRASEMFVARPRSGYLPLSSYGMLARIMPSV